jgi:NADH dehydrogenase [ubiquinone] 1 alpha subcomplex assembly factor 6
VNVQENTASSLLYLCLEAAGVRNSTADHAAGHIGKAVGICTLLRSIAYHCSQSSSVIPSELLRKHMLPSKVLFQGPQSEADSDAIAACVFEVACAARAHVEQGQVCSVVNVLDTTLML